MITELVAKTGISLAFKELLGAVSGHFHDEKIKNTLDQLHKEFFFDKKLNALKTDVRISVFSKSKIPFLKNLS